MYKKRFYRTKTFNSDLISFNVRHFESNLQIYAQSDLTKTALEILIEIHSQVRDYAQSYPEFEKSLKPIKIVKKAPAIIETMQRASRQANVGPMATVAGAIAEAVGKKLQKYSREIIIENGGDIFACVTKTRKVGIFAGLGNVYNQLAITLDPEKSPCGICTSSGQFGHSLSLGKTCATIIISQSCALADGYATAFGNMVNNDSDIDIALKSAGREKGLHGIIIITNSKLAAYGDITFDVLDK